MGSLERRLFVYLDILGACNCGKPKMSGGIEHHISHGDIADPEQYPWIVHVIELRKTTNGTKKNGCTGSMIDHQHVLTAGHCVMKGYGPPYKLENVKVYTGKDRSSLDNANKMDVAEIRVHRSFVNNPKSIYHHDIAVVRLKHPRTDLIPICLTSTPWNNFAGRRAVAAGFGMNEHGKETRNLMKTTVTILSNEQCKYKKYYLGNRRSVNHDRYER